MYQDYVYVSVIIEDLRIKFFIVNSICLSMQHIDYTRFKNKNR